MAYLDALTVLLTADDADSRAGLLLSALAGAAAALAVAILLSIYFRARYRSGRDVVRHGVARSPCSGCWPLPLTICATPH